ncbi:transposase [Nostoc sp. CHAB 5824]|nr:transposase [Nostoc sp. CHAB 5824]
MISSRRPNLARNRFHANIFASRALQEYGRLIETVHILRWYANETNRRRLNRQINKGEALL